MLTDMASNKALKPKYNTALLADEAAGNMFEEYNKIHKNKRSKVKEVILHDIVKKDLLDNIKRIERGFFSLGHGQLKSTNAQHNIDNFKSTGKDLGKAFEN